MRYYYIEVPLRAQTTGIFVVRAKSELAANTYVMEVFEVEAGDYKIERATVPRAVDDYFLNDRPLIFTRKQE